MAVIELHGNLRRMLVTTPNGTIEEWIDSQRCPLLQGAGLTWLGRTTTSAGYEYRNENLQNWNLVACDAPAAVEILQSGRWRRLHPGNLLLADGHAPVGVRAIAGVTITWLCAARGMSKVHLDQPEIVFFPHLAQSLRATIELICADASAPDGIATQPHWLAVASSLAQRIIGLAAEEVTSDELASAWRQVTARPGQPWDLNRLARLAGCSRERLRRTCHASWARSPMRHVTWLRMHYAANLLRRTDRPIADIAAEVGYVRPFAFTAAFGRQFGVTPTRYRTAAH